VSIESFAPLASLYLVGRVHIAVALARLARVLDFRTIVVDAQATFASQERFAHVDELVLAWPDEALEGRLDARSGVAVLTHDPKLDDPALRVALRSSARWGAGPPMPGAWSVSGPRASARPTWRAFTGRSACLSEHKRPKRLP